MCTCACMCMHVCLKWFSRTMPNPWPKEYLGFAASKFLALLTRTITLRCLQETSASVSQGPAQHQGVETEFRCRQCCLDAHGLNRAAGEARVRPPVVSLAYPQLMSSHWGGGVLGRLLRSFLGGTFCQSLLPPRYLLPFSAAADYASLGNSPKSRPHTTTFLSFTSL